MHVDIDASMSYGPGENIRVSWLMCIGAAGIDDPVCPMDLRLVTRCLCLAQWLPPIRKNLHPFWENIPIFAELFMGHAKNAEIVTTVTNVTTKCNNKM